MNSSLNHSGPSSVTATMQMVLLALIPGSVIFFYQNGWGSILNLILAIGSAVAFESLAISLRKKSPLPALSDYSAVVTAVLITLCLPALIPWWIPVLATGFAILLCKHAFGGIGYNLFNPAMVGYAVVLISFPTDLSLWPHQPDAFATPLSESISIVFGSGLKDVSHWDALTGATALDMHRTLRLQGLEIIQFSEQTRGLFGAKNGEWINLAFLIGGLWIFHKKVIQWHIPAAFLGALLLSSVLHNLFLSSPISIAVNLFGGATMLCAFFISTDPVTAATSRRGRIIYAALTGVLVYLIRNYGAFPDGVAFAVLLANCAVPAIDRFDVWLRSTPDGS